MSTEDRSAANRERLDRLRNPERYRDEPARNRTERVRVRPSTLEQRVTQRPPVIDKWRKTKLARLGSPPRPVSMAVQLRAILGGWIQQFGWLFFGFGMVFFWAFAGNAEIGWPLRAGTTATVQGQVTGWRETGSSENEVTIHATQYSYEVNGQRFEGESFAPGRHASTGERVSVEYSVSDPALSRIQGMRSRHFSAWAAFVVIFPAIGLIFIVVGIRYGWRSARLMRNGQVAWGKLVDKSMTNTRINEQPVWKLDFEFTTRNGQTAVASARSHVTDLLEDEPEEPLLYDPDDPSGGVLLDAIPGEPELTTDGRLVLGSASGLFMVLILPLLTIGGHGAFLYFLAG